MTESKPIRISVVVPSFNQGRFLESTLRSILDQEYPNLEVIVIDGGSQDESVSVLEKYSSQLDYWVSQPDAGQTDAIARGFERASGAVLCWLNSDDLHMPNTLGEVGQYFESHPESSFIYGDAMWIDAKGHYLRPKKEHSFIRFIWFYDHNYIPQPSTFWRRELYEDVGGLDTRFHLAMDADLWARFAQHETPTHVRRTWSCMRLYPEQKNQALRAQSNREDALIRERYVGEKNLVELAARKVAAKALRASWKAVTGCYRR